MHRITHPITRKPIKSCYPIRITIRRAYMESSSALKKLAKKVSKKVNKALDARTSEIEKALWIKYELMELTGITLNPRSDFDLALIKLRCPDWLTKKFRRLAREDLLHMDQMRGAVGRGKSYATSNIAVTYRKRQLEAHQDHLSKFAVRTGSKVRTLSEICNTTHKRVSELYVFSLGIDQLAQDKDMNYMLITLTCPPRMHPRPTTKNSWDGTTTKEAYEFLNRSNEAVKRRLSNKKIKFSRGDAFGIIVTEPHADGCPHIHILMYHRPEDQSLIIQEYRKEFDWSARAIDFSIEDKDRSDAARGSSYLFKYLSDSFCDSDNADTDATSKKRSKAKYIDTWRSQTNMRAFRTFGLRRCATLWRQCRKLRDIKEDCSPLLQSAISAACENDFHRFYDLSQDLKIATEESTTRYGELYHKVIGVQDIDKQVRSAPACEIVRLSSIELPQRPNLLGLGLNHSDPRSATMDKAMKPNIAYAEKTIGNQ